MDLDISDPECPQFDPSIFVNALARQRNYPARDALISRFLSNVFGTISTVQESTIVVKSDRRVKFESKPMVLFHNHGSRLDKGGLPDLRFQDFYMETRMQRDVNEFMKSGEYLGLLIGPNGCGKSHELLSRAKTRFTVYIDGQACPTSNEPYDLSVSSLKRSFESITNTWRKRNEDLAQLRIVGYAFLLSRMLFLRFLKEKYPELTPKQFLMHQLLNSSAMGRGFSLLSSWSFHNLLSLRDKLIDFQCFFCVDEAHELVAHLGDTIISSMEGNHIQPNGDVNENAKRGTLSILLHAIKHGQFSNKLLFAGTSSVLRNIDYFGSYETKPVGPLILNQFDVWDPTMALNFVTSYVAIEPDILKKVLTDNYRPRILENFVYDLLSVAMNDKDSPNTRNKQVEQDLQVTELQDIIEESYREVIHKFTRLTIEPLAKTIRDHHQVEVMLKLLLSSMMTGNGRSINYELNKDQETFFIETIGSIYLVSWIRGSTFYEGYVIDSFLRLFEEELCQFRLSSSLDLLRSIIGREGKKTTAKGVPFEAVVLADLVQQNGPLQSQVFSSFGLVASYELNVVCFPIEEWMLEDEKRPWNAFLRPCNPFRSDILTFLSKEVCVSFGIKIDTLKIPSAVHEDNHASTDPYLFFSKSGDSTQTEKQKKWIKIIKESPLKFSARFLVEFPEPAASLSVEHVQKHENETETVIIVITKNNMRKLLSEDVAILVEFITKP
jgi:hypothetical protein